MDDERIEYIRPVFHVEPKPLLYRADGTPLRRPVGYAIQTSQTFPELTKRTPKGKGKGKRGC